MDRFGRVRRTSRPQPDDGRDHPRTAPDVDAERDFLFVCLERTDVLAEHYVVDGFHQHLEGRNGGGDPLRTDGGLYVGLITEGNSE